MLITVYPLAWADLLGEVTQEETGYAKSPCTSSSSDSAGLDVTRFVSPSGLWQAAIRLFCSRQFGRFDSCAKLRVISRGIAC